MNKICTSIEQSKKLIELGIDINTADMFWDLLDGDEPTEKDPDLTLVGFKLRNIMWNILITKVLKMIGILRSCVTLPLMQRLKWFVGL